MHADATVRWFNRFRLSSHGGLVHFRDLLTLHRRSIASAQFEGLATRDREIAYFRFGFMAGALSSAFAEVQDQPQHAADALFWQFPCRTEAATWGLHAGLAEPHFADDNMHVYLGLPWASWIDKAGKQAWGDAGPAVMQQQLQWVGVRLSGLRHALAELGVTLRVHSVCQHAYWQQLLPAWRKLGVTDLWLSHCPTVGVPLLAEGLTLHPWRLYAVNVEDPSRRQGLQMGREPSSKSVLASFIGAHASHYLSDVRLRLQALAAQPDFVVHITDQWHFEDVVYRHQVMGQPHPAEAGVAQAASVERYNALLSDSVFSLCPSGAGPNTIRLWESLAVGAVPVLLGVQPELPRGGSLAAIDWDSIVLRVADDQLPDLPQLLRSIPMDEVRRRQRLGMEAFALVQQQRCF